MATHNLANITQPETPVTPPIAFPTTQLTNQDTVPLHGIDPSNDNYDEILASIENPQTSRWINVQHKLDTVDDFILLEYIEDLKDKYNDLDGDDFKKAIYEEFDITDQNIYKSLQDRISSIIIEIDKHHQTQSNSNCNDKNLNLKSPTLELKVDASFIIKEESKNNHVSTPSIDDTKSYNDLKHEFEQLMVPLCESSQNMIQQCKDEQCRIDQDISQCPCIKRICVMLKIYNKFQKLSLSTQSTLKTQNHQNHHLISQCVTIEQYQYKNLINDFLHIHKCHTSNNHKMQILISQQICKEYKCDLKECRAALRQSRVRNLEIESPNKLKFRTTMDEQQSEKANDNVFFGNDQDLIYSRKCDSIHAYFLHSKIKEGTNYYPKKRIKRKISINVMKQGTDIEHKGMDSDTESDSSEPYDEDEDEKEGPSILVVDYSEIEEYAGTAQDIEWMEHTNHIDIKLEQKIYDKLLEKMGHFKWQSSHGFRNLQSKGLQHIKPKYKNIKEEVLNNEYHHITVDNWNQTLRKSKVFSESWASKSIRTLQNGQFQDQIMGHCASWQANQYIDLESILVLKLYTDFDKLQYHLKRCFRIDYIYDELIYNESTRNGLFHRKKLVSSQTTIPYRLSEMTQSQSKASESIEDFSMTEMKEQKDTEDKLKACINDLEERLSQFFSWRGKLLININKFGKIFEPTDPSSNNGMILYHGVNDKMILHPITTQSFFGPLSTSSSYHVAKTFASDKGMVLAISSQYPRLNTSSAFDASLISDYPEEQEWLIGFIYLRINQIYSESNTFEMDVEMPIDSEIRFAFFAIHLFREQIYSMNDEVERYLDAYLRAYLFVYKSNIDRKKYKNVNKRNKLYKYLKKIIKWAQNEKGKYDENKIPKGVHNLEKSEQIRKNRIHYILAKQFKEFCVEPNLKQIVKIDSISNGLKKFFLDYDEKNKCFTVSFEKILNIYNKLEEIHFLNQYKLDDLVLEKLIKQIEKKGNTLKSVKFLYYDYNDPLEDSKYFKHPKELKIDLVNKLRHELNWQINYEQNTNQRNGYSIKIRQKQ